MDIKKINSTVEIEFTLDRLDDEGKPVAVKLMVNFVSIDEIKDFLKPGKKPRLSLVIREILIDAVLRTRPRPAAPGVRGRQHEFLGLLDMA